MSLVRTRSRISYNVNDPVGATDWDALYTTALEANNTGTTYWVDPVLGSNGNAGTSKGAAFADLEKALTTISAGDEIIVVDGEYSDSNADMMRMRINDDTGQGGTGAVAFAGGVSHTQRTIIRAETPFGVILNFDSATENLSAAGAPVRLETQTFVWVDGFKIRMFTTYDSNSGDPPTCATLLADSNTMTRCSARKNTNTDFGGGFSATGDDVLLQDCFGCGATRYGIQGGGGLSSTQQNSIFRRCVWRTDFDADSSPQPHGGIVYYGSSSNGNGNHDYQNCISINGRRPTEFNAANGMYGGIYTTHAPLDVNGRGCIIIDWSGRFAGWYIGGSGGADVIGLHDSLILDSGTGSESTQVGIAAANLVTNQTLDQLTVGGWDGGNILGGGNVDTPTNSLLLTGAESAFNPLLRDGSSNGCEIKYMIGPFMSRYGDTDYNVPQTDTRLWPFPYEDEIREEFLITMATPTGYSPTNTQNRGFCATGENLTKYIHEIRGETLDLDGFYA